VSDGAPAIAQECVEGYLFAAPPLRLLIFRRPPGRGRIWVPVSGKVEASDPDLESALRRELREETGLDRARRIFPLDWTVEFPMDGTRWRLTAFGVEVDADFEPRLSAEHEASRWVSPDEAERRLHYADNREAARRLAARVAPGAPKA
jgi:8-oxo-dGTP pyrophosphatase MutT (NUDIX family)